MPIRRHTLVREDASPDDPALRAYWGTRQRGKISTFPSRWVRIARKQGEICPQCQMTLSNDEELHVHHIKHRQQGGDDQGDCI